MAKLPYLDPRVVGAVDRRGVPALAAGSFVTNASSDPVVVGGIISSVRRLENTGLEPFFRVKLNGNYPVEKDSTTLTFSVKATALAAPHTADLVNDLIIADPADARAKDEVDVAIRNSGGSLVDTGGLKVMVQIVFSS